MSVSGEIRLMTWTFAKMLGKKRYDVATVEKKMETNESLLETAGEHPDEERIGQKEEDDRDEGEDDDRRGFDVKGEPGADCDHSDKVREHLADDDR